MRQYLCFKRIKKMGEVVEVHGRIRHKKHGYAELTREEHFGVKQSHLIVGADNAGKSRWISKLSKESGLLWRGVNVLKVRSVDALTDWYASLPYQYRRGLDPQPKTTPERIEAIKEWLKGGVLLIDDVHRATGRKVDYLSELISVSKTIVVSTTSHHKIHPKLRGQIDVRKPVIHDLYSQSTYDATTWAVWIMVVIMMVAGAPEGAVLLGGASLMRSGAKSRNQI